MAPSTSPISIAFAVPSAWEEVPIARQTVAGIGSGMKKLKISPKRETIKIIKNYLKIRIYNFRFY